MLRNCLLVSVLVGCSTAPSASEGDGSAIDWSAHLVQLTARSMVLTIDGVTFTDASMPIEVENSSNGTDTDVTWVEGGYTPRIHFDYGKNATHWYFGQVRVYRIDISDWIRSVGPYFSTPLDQAFDGDLSFEVDENGHHATMQLAGAHLAPFGI